MKFVNFKVWKTLLIIPIISMISILIFVNKAFCYEIFGSSFIVDKNIQNEVPAGNYYICSSVNMDMLIDVAGCSIADGANVNLWTRNCTNAQKFSISYDEYGYAAIKNASGKVLDVHGCIGRPGQNVKQWTYTGVVNQKWIIKKVGNDYKINSALADEHGDHCTLDIFGCLYNEGTNIQIYNDNNGDNQKNKFINIDSNEITGEKIIDDGFYSIKMSSSPQMCIDVPANSMQDNTRLNLWTYHGSYNQIFYFKYEEKTKCYTITSILSSKLLDAEGKNPFPCSNVVQYTENNDDNQKWALSKRWDGTIQLLNRHTALALDVYGGFTTDGIKIETYTPNNMKSQKFILVNEKSIKNGIYYILSKVANDRYLDVPAFSWEEGKQLVIYAGNTAYNHKYLIEEREKGIYSIRSLASGLYVSAKSNKVVQLSILDDNSKWRIVNTGAGNIAVKTTVDIIVTFDGNSSATLHSIVVDALPTFIGAKLCFNSTDNFVYIEYVDSNGNQASTLDAEQKIIADAKAAEEAASVRPETQTSPSYNYYGGSTSNQYSESCTGGNIALR